MQKIRRVLTADEFVDVVQMIDSTIDRNWIINPIDRVRNFEAVFNSLNKNKEFYSAVFLVENDYCPYCELNILHKEKGTASSAIDHAKPLKTNKHLAVSFDNLVPICVPCNIKKSYVELNNLPNNHDFNDISFEYEITLEAGECIIKNILISSTDNETVKFIKALGLIEKYNNPTLLSEISRIVNLLFESKIQKLDLNFIPQEAKFNSRYSRLIFFILQDKGYIKSTASYW